MAKFQLWGIIPLSRTKCMHSAFSIIGVQFLSRPAAFVTLQSCPRHIRLSWDENPVGKIKRISTCHRMDQELFRSSLKEMISCNIISMHIASSRSCVVTLKPLMKISVTEHGGKHQPSVWNSLDVINKGYTKRCVQIFPDEVSALCFIGH